MIPAKILLWLYVLVLILLLTLVTSRLMRP